MASVLPCLAWDAFRDWVSSISSTCFHGQTEHFVTLSQHSIFVTLSQVQPEIRPSHRQKSHQAQG